MDKYEIRLLGRALKDLDGIYGYIAKSLSEPAAALKLVENIEKEILSLEYMPYRYGERLIGAYANKGYRQLIIKNYTVIYRIDESTKTVIIVTVRYAPSQF